jgi:hypothetical protein
MWFVVHVRQVHTRWWKQLWLPSHGSDLFGVEQLPRIAQIAKFFGLDAKPRSHAKETAEIKEEMEFYREKFKGKLPWFTKVSA